MERLALLVHRRARRVLWIAGVVAIAAAVFGGPVASLLSAESGDFQDPAAENIAADERLERALGRDAEVGLVAIAPRRAAARVQRRIAAEPGVADTVGGEPGMVSADGRTALVGATFAPDADELEVARRLRAELPEDVLVGGPGVVNPEIGTKVKSDLARAELLAFPLLFLLSLWVFRSVVAALLPPLIGGISIVVTFVALRGVDAGVTSLSVFAVNLVTGIGLGLAIDYSLFVVSRFREELARGLDSRAALVRTMATAGRSVLFSSLTIAAAMAALLVFPLRFLYSMGIGGLICSLTAALVALTVLPAVLAVLGPRMDAGAPRRWRAAALREGQAGERGAWYRLAHAVMRRPGRVALATGALMILAGLPFLRADFITADHKMLPQGSETRVVAAALERDFPAAGADPIRIVMAAGRSERAAVASWARQVRALDGVHGSTKIKPLGDTAWRMDLLQRGDPLSPHNREVVERVRALPAPFDVEVGGRAAASVDQRQALGDRLPLALALLSVTTVTILFLMTGSVLLPLKALVMNLLTVSAAFGALVLLFQDGLGEALLDFESAGGLEMTQPILLFAIAFGLATDYGVFLLSRIKEGRDQGLGEREAVAFGVERTGRIVTAAALLFCVAIGAFATSGILFIKQVGVGTAIAVAIDATIVRALLVPALMALLGKWNWWAPRPLRRVHARFGLRETAEAPA